jgi:acyl transferase domain-containing protein
LIKLTLSLTHKIIPASLNCERPNSRFNFDSSPFYVNTKSRTWEAVNGDFYAGISSFGFGGTNCHMILSDLNTVIKKAYKATRTPLAPINFNKKHIWIDKTTIVSKNIKATEIANEEKLKLLKIEEYDGV